MPYANHVRKNEMKVVFAVFMDDILHTKIKSLHNILKVAHYTKQRYDKAYFILRCIMFGMFFKKVLKLFIHNPVCTQKLKIKTILCFPRKCFKLYGHRQIN